MYLLELAERALRCETRVWWWIMKKNIYRVSYGGELDEHGRWWIWDEKCDRCGRVIRDHTIQSSNEPVKEETDFCSECLRYLLDDNIPYEEAKAIYGSK